MGCGDGPASRMLKLAARCVLASLRAQRTRGVRLASSIVAACGTPSLNTLVAKKWGAGYLMDFNVDLPSA